MQAINTHRLLSLLVDYDFYDWDSENQQNYEIVFGLPREKLSVLGYPRLYESWGYDAVNNDSANQMFNPDEWLYLERTFFDWLKTTEDILFPQQKVIVTPDLYREWLIEEYMLPEWESKHTWFKDDCKRYYDLLIQSGVIHAEPNLREHYRGALVESFEEVEILGKISIKGVPLLFFSDKKMVIRITDYLTVRMMVKDEQTCNQIKEVVSDLLCAQFLW